MFYSHSQFVYDDISALNAVVDRRGFHYLLLRAQLFIGRARLGANAHWLKKCKHEPRGTEVGAPIKYVMCQKKIVIKNSETTTCHYCPVCERHTAQHAEHEKVYIVSYAVRRSRGV